LFKTHKNKNKNKFIVSERQYIGITATINTFRSTLASCEEANAICERVHQILGMMMRTSEIDMANLVEPAYIDTSINKKAWAFR
jgi:hypothetical protein